MLPYDMDVLKPTAARYASLKFRRVAPLLYPERLDFADAAELVAFLHVVPIWSAKWIFHWAPPARKEADRLLKHLSQDEVVAKAIEANHMAMDADDGWAVWEAMRDGGWTSGTLPTVTRMALQAKVHEGMSMAELARQTGLTRDQVRVAVHGLRKPRPLYRAALLAE